MINRQSSFSYLLPAWVSQCWLQNLIWPSTDVLLVMLATHRRGRSVDHMMVRWKKKGEKVQKILTRQAQQSILLSEVYISIFMVVVYSTLRCGASQIFVVIFIFLYCLHSISQFKTNCPVCEVLLACPVQRMFLLVFNSSCWDLISSKWDIFYFPGVSNLAFICNSLD